MATGNIKISELNPLGPVTGAEAIPVSVKIQSSAYWESYKMNAGDLAAYIGDKYSLAEALQKANDAYTTAQSAYSYVNESVSSLAYEVKEATEVFESIDEAIQDMGGVEEFTYAIEKIAYISGDVNEIKDTTIPAIQDSINTVDNKVTTLDGKTIKGYVEPAQTSPTNIDNFTCDKSLANGEQYTRIVRNNGTDSITIALSTSSGYITPDGQPITLTVPAGGYGEFNFLKSDNMIFVRAL